MSAAARQIRSTSTDPAPLPPRPRRVTADQGAGCPPAVAGVITAAVAEYEAGEALEAVVARDADKLECLVQAVEYRHQGVDNVQRWIDSSRAALKTASAHRLTDAALGGEPLAWLNPPPPVE